MEPAEITKRLELALTDPVNPKPGELWRHYRGHGATILFLAIDKCSLGVEVVYLCTKVPEVPFTCPLAEWMQPVEGMAGIVPRYLREQRPAG